MPDAIWYPMRTIGFEDIPMTTRIPALLIAFGLTPVVMAQNAVLINTFTNPAPAAFDNFGYKVAGVGNDRVLVSAYRDDTGAVNAGAAYLFSTNGTLLTTFTNPDPTTTSVFGTSVAAVGVDRVLISATGNDAGAEDAGAAFLFSTDGRLLTTITNPSPAIGDGFGISVAAVGVDRVLIGAVGDDEGAANAGAAYLFGTDGAIITTFAKPSPTAEDRFGISVASFGSDRVLIGSDQDNAGAADGRAAFLYNTNGALLASFIKPNPATSSPFGTSVAAVGGNLVLVATWSRGTAYLFNTNGVLLETMRGPVPTPGDFFGVSVAAIGSDRLAIGAMFDDAGVVDGGAGHLFGTDGEWLMTLINPGATADDRFGSSLAAVGADHLLVGAYGVDTGATDAGVAYLFFLPPPTLAITPTAADNNTISWLPNTPGFVLQETESLLPANWTNSPSGATNPTDVPATSPGKFFRLIKP